MVEGSEPTPYTHTYLPPPPGKDRTGIPLWGAALLAVGALVAGLFVGVIGGMAANDDRLDAPEVRTVGPAGDMASFDSRPGECFLGELAHEELAFSYLEVKADCDGPHELEVFARFDAPAPTDGEPLAYRDDDLRWFASDACLLSFEHYVGVDYEESVYDYMPVVPSQTAWRAGARTVHCVLYDVDGETLTQSAKGSNR